MLWRDHAGASGFLLKDTEPETLLNSIRTVFQGNAIIAPSATKRLIEKMMEGDFMAANVGRPENSATTSATDSIYTDPELDELTDREREVLIEIGAWIVESGDCRQAFHQSAYGENACGAYSVENQCA